MANKEAVFTVKVNTGNSVQDLQSADQAVQQLGKDLQQTQTVANDSSGTDAFAQRLAELDAKLEAGGLSMREMTQTMKEYQTIALQAGAQSPVGQQAIQSASQLKDEIGDLKNATTALSSDTVKLDTALSGITVGAQAFAGVQSAMALAGVENENLVKSMQQLQAVQGVVNSVTTISNALQKDAILGIQLRNALTKAQNFIMGTNATTTATTATASTGLAVAQGGVGVATTGASGALKLFRIALISTGIGAIVVLIGMLIANFEEIQNSLSGVTDWLGITDTEAEKNAENEKQRKERAIENEKRLQEARERAYNSEQAQYDNKIRLAKAEGKSTYDLEKAKIQGSIRYQQTLKKELELKLNELRINSELIRRGGLTPVADLMDQKIYELQGKINTANQAIESAQTDLKILDIDQKKANAEATKKASESSKKRADDKKKAQEQERKDQEKADKKSEEDLKKHNLQMQMESEANDEAIRRSKMSARDLELSDIQDEYFQKRTQAEQLGAEGAELVAQLTIEEETKKAEVRKKYADAELQAEAERETKRRERQKMLNDLILNEEQRSIEEINKSTEDAKKALQDRLNSADENERITKEQYDNALIVLEQRKQDKLTEIQKKAIEQRNEQAKKEREESLKGVTDFIAKSQMVLDHIKTVDALFDEIDQARLNKLAKSRNEDLENLDAKMQAELNAEGVTAEQKKQIEEKFAQQKYQVQLQAYNAEEKIKKAQFNRDKAIKLSQIAIDTASAIVKAIAQYGPPPSPMGIAGIASAGIIGITQALAVANQQYKSGSAPSPPSLSGGGGGSMAGASASSFTSTATPTSTAGLTEQGTPTPTTTSTQVYVLESDISATQNKVKLQDAKTSF